LGIGQGNTQVLFDDNGGRPRVFEYRAIFELRAAKLLGSLPDSLLQGLIHFLQGTLGAVDVVHQHLGAAADKQDDGDSDYYREIAALQGALEVIIEQRRPDSDDQKAGLVYQG